ncbi:phosphonopyruvate decarboxylase [Streptomyces cinnabarinus]|uniref:Phosphonopyruvate decarboxylase n=1 Tax=Streptomyces cinnabarinus TaxID=67287 RepID=A0ABY7KFV8_9ACTN|nr:phosphonopyruvate decarboxylase [Streptomyces cinnabarinus]WAZ21816.1 phosphonopyruvate decarboxylase [Streptomyces cinnabarinus]
MEAETFCQELERRGYGFFSGVPCSYLQGPFALLEQRGSYVPAPNEGIALSLAAGAELAGTRSAVLIQNSGLGNLLDPLTSLILAYDIPVLLVASLRGWPRAEDDEPHHAAMGASTIGILEATGIAHGILQEDPASLAGLLDRAERARLENRPFVILVPKGTVGTCAVDAGTEGEELELDRQSAVEALVEFLDDQLVFSTTGMISRELFAAGNRPENFYMQGSMGHAIGLGLGTALRLPERGVTVVDGDGAALMHLGGSALVGERRPENLTHIVLDNGAYDSTGGQRASRLRWTELALSLGYRTARTVTTAAELTARLRDIAGTPGPHMVGVTIRRGSSCTPPRVTSAHSNSEIRARFQKAAAAPSTTTSVEEPPQ